MITLKPIQLFALAIMAYGVYRLARGPQTIAGVVAEADRKAPYWILGLGFVLFLTGVR